MKDTAEKLMDILAEITHSDERADDAYQLAGQLSYELDEAKERIARLEAVVRASRTGLSLTYNRDSKTFESMIFHKRSGQVATFDDALAAAIRLAAE